MKNLASFVFVGFAGVVALFGTSSCSRGMVVPTGCDPACASGESCCASACIPTRADNANCGGCGVVCASGQTCNAGVCTGRSTDATTPRPDANNQGMCPLTCAANQRCCGTMCVNNQTPTSLTDGRNDSAFRNCTACGVACSAETASRCAALDPNGAPRCACGSFNACTGAQKCLLTNGTFSCSDPATNPNNCGGTGTVCGPGERCVDSVCQCGNTGASCPTGTACANNTCVDTQSNPMNCGMPGNVCPAHAPTCSNGMCRCGTGPACTAPTAGLFGIGGMPGSSCCMVNGALACVPNDDTQCACGGACAGDDTCGVSGAGLGMMGGNLRACCGQMVVFSFECSAPTDGGVARDAGPGDAGAADAGAADTGASDAGASDAGATDAGATDAGAFDAGS